MSLRTTTNPKIAAPGPGLSAELESLLRDLAAQQSELLALTVEHRAAIVRADPAAIASCVQRQAALFGRARAAEQRRRALVDAWAPRERGITLTDLASRVEEPARARLLALGGQVRALVERLARENRVVRAATESLMAHMDGLVRQVARRLSQSGTYSRRGGIDTGAPLVAGIDFRH
jgi:hypothetical protein